MSAWTFMRLAIVVSSTYKKSSQLPTLPSAAIDARLIAERLAEPDARSLVEELDARQDLDKRIEQVFARHPADPGERSLVVYFSGHVLAREEGDLALLSSSRRGGSIALSSLAGMLARRASDVLVILEAVHGPDPEDPMASVSVVAAARESIDPKHTGISLLVGARPSDRAVPDGPSLFTRLVLLALERLSPEGTRTGAVTASAVFEAMRAEEERFIEIPATGFFRGRGDFPLLVAPSIVVADGAADPATAAEPSRDRLISSAPSTLRSGVSEPPPPSSAPASIPPASVPPPSKRPLVAPAVPELIESGDRHAQAGSHDDAIADYKRALLMLGSKRTPDHAALYVKIGDAKRLLGKDSEAIHNYDKALGIDADNAGAFESARALLESARDWEHLERLYQRRLQTIESAEKRAAIWRELSLHWLDDANDLGRGILALDHWLAQAPTDVDALERLVAAHKELGRHAAGNLARRRLADALADDPQRRAAVLAEAARVAAEHLPNKDEAVELARAALDADPSALSALEVAATLMARRRRWPELAELYQSVVSRSEDPHVQWDLGKRLGMLYLAEIHDAAAAKRALSAALEREPADVDLVWQIADLYEADQDYRGVADVLVGSAPHLPVRSDLYRRALAAFDKLGDADPAWAAASVLDLLGDADINESLVADAHRPEGLVAAQSTLDDSAWNAGLFWPERDASLTAVLSAVSAAAVSVRIRELEDGGKLPVLDPATRQDPEKSTATITRSLVWTARLLGVPMPALYVMQETEDEMHALAAREPTAVASLSLARGLGLPELAFLWGRHLCFFRPEHYLLVFYPSLRDVGSLLLAALSLGGESRQSASLEGDVAGLAAVIGDAMDDDSRRALRSAVAGFEPRNTRRRITAWARSVHLAAARAGLLACGDIHRAAELVRRFPPAGELTPDEQIADLCAWSIGPGCAELRRRLGIAVP